MKTTIYFIYLGLHEESDNEIAKPYTAHVIYTSTTPLPETDTHAESEPESNFENSNEDNCVEGCDIPDPTRFIKGLITIFFLNLNFHPRIV